MWEIVAGLLAIVVTLLKLYADGRLKQPATLPTEYEREVQDFDKALADGDTDALSRAFDVLRAPAKPEGDSDPSGQDCAPAAGRQL